MGVAQSILRYLLKNLFHIIMLVLVMSLANQWLHLRFEVVYSWFRTGVMLGAAFAYIFMFFALRLCWAKITGR